MLRRTKGRFLICVLVVTGLSGTYNDTAVSLKERKYALTLLKDSKVELLETVKPMTKKQLNYKIPSTQLSVKDILVKLETTEEKLWQTIAHALEQPINPEKRLDIELTDQQLVDLASDGKLGILSLNTFKQANPSTTTEEEALLKFKEIRNEHIKYMKTSTEDLRNHLVLTPAGWLDCYQMILLIGASSKNAASLIATMQKEKEFPSN